MGINSGGIKTLICKDFLNNMMTHKQARMVDSNFVLKTWEFIGLFVQHGFFIPPHRKKVLHTQSWLNYDSAKAKFLKKNAQAGCCSNCLP